jgi:hypothetical protein
MKLGRGRETGGALSLVIRKFEHCLAQKEFLVQVMAIILQQQ